MPRSMPRARACCSSSRQAGASPSSQVPWPRAGTVVPSAKVTRRVMSVLTKLEAAKTAKEGGMRTRLIKTDGLVQQVLDAGFEDPNAPLVLLIHGFPELGVSWRAQVENLSQA